MRIDVEFEKYKELLTVEKETWRQRILDKIQDMHSNVAFSQKYIDDEEIFVEVLLDEISALKELVDNYVSTSRQLETLCSIKD